MSQVICVSHHCAVYRGFTIITLPRKKQTPITRYHVWHLGESFGKFDAMAEATKYIDGLWRMKGESNDDLYNKISELIEFQLSLHFDSYTSKKQWEELFASADSKQIAEALANNLHSAGLDVVTARRILNKPY